MTAEKLEQNISRLKEMIVVFSKDPELSHLVASYEKKLAAFEEKLAQLNSES